LVNYVEFERIKKMYAYVGSRTSLERHARGEGISVFKVDQDIGSLELVQVLGDLVNPSFLALNTKGDRLYSVHGDQQEVSVFSVNPTNGMLKHLQTQHCGGKNPVHLALDPSERFLVVSNHLSSHIAVMPVLSDGKLGAVCQTVELPGAPGPHRVEQPFAKPHFNPFDPSGRFVVIPDKGLDKIFVYRFHNGRLTPASTPWTDSREASGPRHIAFHPQKPFAYAVNELDSTVTGYHFDITTGALKPLQILSTLPDTFTGNSRASEIMLSGDGRTLYASNRGCDSIAVFSINPATGHLTFIEANPTLGKTPRYFSLTPNGRYAFALNEDSDSIVTLSVDTNSGALTPTGEAVKTGSPVCMIFLNLTEKPP
jgi:6-phosphogluconolactonase